MNKLYIYGGDSIFCEVGIPTGESDWEGNELFSGDIVQIWHGDYLGTDYEEWLPSSGLTAIVGQQYQSVYNSKEIKHLTDTPELFTMGIASQGVQSREWKVTLVKSHKDIVDKERFPSFRFNYRLRDDLPQEESK